jgi:small conductance mechanosensitive channel
LLRAREPIAAALRRFAAGLRSERLRSFVPWELIAGAGNIAAIALVWVHYAVWAVGVPGGFSLLLRATVLTIAVLAVANIASVWLEQRLTRPTPRPAEHEGAYEEPGETPGARRAAVLPTALLLVKALAAVAILHLWGIDIVGWFATPAGQDVLQRLLRIALICFVAFLIWTVIRRSVTTYLTAKDPAGNNRYSNRARTLANIARNAALVLIAVFAFATVLSELGIETAPLLAGAGVAGLAIGFGAQRLVQDIITGLFILLGDTIRVGDVINVAGKGGAVESMSMRTVTLRGYDGAVHTIPYSAIDTVTNLTKDFSFWVFDIGVAYRESVDQVIAVLREIDAELRSEWPFRRLILEPLDIAGLDQFGESAIVVKARIKTRPGDQWRVGREFNRRIKRRFDELGIEIPFPHRTIYFGVDKSGAAPPLAIEHHRRGLLREEAATAAPPGEPRPAPQPVAAQARRGA